MKALFFGSIGTIVETSEIQRQSFNLAFKDAGLTGIGILQLIVIYCENLAERKESEIIQISD